MKRKKVKILGLSYSQSQVGSYVLVLSEIKGGRKIPVIIKPAEAQHIAMKLENIKTQRPMTHDLMKSMSDTFQIDIQEVHVYSLAEGIFYTRIVASNGVDEVELDCSIGDGLALALTYKCPIWVNQEIIDAVGIAINEEEVETAKEDDEDDFEIDSIHDLETGEEVYSGKSKKRTVSIEDLEHMMDNAIANEEYEIAAEIRDRIQTLRDEQIKD
jgi:bifunctional DNase/RNase